MLDLDDTICAPATASGVGLRGLIRMSGSRSVNVASQVLCALQEPLPAILPRAIGAQIELSELGAIPLTAMVWPTMRSYTRQPSVELHYPANRVITEAIIAKLVAQGARLARPGEFTLRAFLAGRVDLAQAEAILGVIHAESDNELKTGLHQLAGGVFGPIHRVREDLLCLLADVEAGLDFVEEDIEFVTGAEALRRVRSHIELIEQIVVQLKQRAVDSAGWRVVLVGPPNAGKSRLFNALAEQEAAIVSPQAGTTRDVVQVELDWKGHRLMLMDLAGLEPSPSAEVDSLAQAKAHEAIAKAHVVLRCAPANELGSDSSTAVEGRSLAVATKCDLGVAPLGSLATSAATNEGLTELRAAVVVMLDDLAKTKMEALGGGGLRSTESLVAARKSLAYACQRLEQAGPDDAFAMDLRAALDHLGEITGAVVTDDILDKVFSRFCIGK